MDTNTTARLHALLNLPVAALGTLREQAPFVSMVPVVPAPDGSGFFIHVSHLAQHTRDLMADPRMSLMLMAPWEAHQDPLALPRATLQGRAEELPGDSDAHAQAAAAYLARFPQAKATLELGDFAFFLLRPESGRLVLGFGRAQNLDAPDIKAALAPLR